MERNFSGVRVVVTGGAGFIGSHLVRRLVEQQAQVLVLTERTRHERLAGILPLDAIRTVAFSDAVAAQKHIIDFKPEYVFSLEAKIIRGNDPRVFEEFVTGHVHHIWNILHGAQAAHVKRVIHLGTIDEYGRLPAPFSETDRENPQNLYALTKLFGTRTVMYAAHALGLPATVIRPSLTYGPSQHAGMLVTNTIEACLAGTAFPMTAGDQTRDFLYVDDLVDGMLAVAVNEPCIGEIINLGSGTQTPVKEVVERINTLCGNRAVIQFGAEPYRPDENMEYWLQIQKAERLCGYAPRVTLAEGLSRTVAARKALRHPIQ
ncbi:NAD-dependent epimerase/dehydratase family protein [Candidatus Kaiserbacteria bacterium]|nr:NAD-dependent epimerase/dehydratase family protein [Candidatus Kaiserbacteria bacterium]